MLSGLFLKVFIRNISQTIHKQIIKKDSEPLLENIGSD